MCGASSEQKDMFAAQSSFYKEMTAQYQQVFGKQQAILDDLTAAYKPILDKGPNQRGFSPEERTAIDSNISESTATNFAHAKTMLQEDQAARGGSDFIPNGSDAQIESGLSATAASTQSTLENEVERADWETGRNMFNTAAGVLGGVAGQLDPARFADATTSAGGAASKTANDITAASNSIWSSVVGGLSGIAGQAVGGWAEGKASKGD